MSFEELMEFIKKPTFSFNELDIENKTLTYNKRHFSILKKGARAWNSWRKRNPHIIPQLSSIYLESEKYGDLSGYDLGHANLAGFQGFFISMRHTSLVEANLERANLEGGSFDGADFSSANLKNIKIKDTSFSRAILREANLNEASISDSDFTEVTLEEAYMEKIHLYNVNLSGANLKQANLSCANLFDVQLVEANLNRASLEKAVMNKCSIFGTTFIKTNFSEVKANDVYISSQGMKGVPISDLTLAQYACLKQCDSPLTKKFINICNLEGEIISYSKILIDKYGGYRLDAREISACLIIPMKLMKLTSFLLFRCIKIIVVFILNFIQITIIRIVNH